jgi:hypothetical protein
MSISLLKSIPIELQAQDPLVTSGTDRVVFDTLIEDMPADLFPDRPPMAPPDGIRPGRGTTARLPSTSTSRPTPSSRSTNRSTTSC